MRVTQHALERYKERVTKLSTQEIRTRISEYWRKGEAFFDFNYTKEGTTCRIFGDIVMVKRDKSIITIYFRSKNTWGNAGK